MANSRTAFRSVFAAPAVWVPALLAAVGVAWAVFALPAALVVGVGVVLGILATAALDRRRGARTLAAQTDVLDLLGDVPAVVWRGSDAVRRTWVSKNWAQRTGQALDHAVGEGWLAMVHAEDRDAVRSAARVAAESAGPFAMEYRLRVGDGRYHRVVDRAVATFDRAGTWTGYSGVVTDVDTEDAEQRVRVDPEVQAQAASLIERVSTVESEYGELQAIDRVRGEFLEALSSEMSDALSDLGDVLVLMRNAPLPDHVQDYVQRARDRTAQLIGYRRHIDHLVHPGLESHDECAAAFDLRRLVDQVYTLHQEEAKSRKLELRLNVDDHVPVEINGISADFRAILKALYRAALALTRDGIVTCAIECKPTPTESTELRIAITSAGAEFDVESFERAFYPVETVGDDAPAGLGLGACRRRVEALGGRVGVHRTMHGGCLWVTLTVEEVNPSAHGRRAYGRLRQVEVGCTLGPVLDISMGGLRTEARRCPTGTMEVEITDGEEHLRLNAEVVWTRKLTRGKWEVGLHFVGMGPSDATRLGRFAARNRLRQIMDAA